MRWPTRETRRQRLEAVLFAHGRTSPLPGIPDDATRRALALQLVASLRREEYTQRLLSRPVDPARADPRSQLFDPERAVVHHMRAGDYDEAAWLVFLMTHFGKAGDTGWLRLKDVYGMLGQGRWSWAIVTSNLGAFRQWLAANAHRVGGRFGNHRKYESLRADANGGTAAVVESYVAWVGPSHTTHFRQAVRAAGNDPHVIFDALFRDMRVSRFGRLARFDYLALIGRYGIAPIEPGSAYLDGATGPIRGAALLFEGTTNGALTAADLQKRIDGLAADLGVGMQVMEDALCNWQKSPREFRHFTG